MAKVKPATIEDLMLEPGKAELLNGEIVRMAASGFLPGFAATRIWRSLDDYALAHRTGYALGDNVGYRVELPHRESFCPDASYHVGPPSGMKFVEGAPRFAVEVRSEGDYGPKAEKDLVRKRADYFACGTQVVWDVDMLSDAVVRVYRADDPGNPTVYRRGDEAEAEPAMPGWKLKVDSLFPYFVKPLVEIK
jgi:Uma2 family endonuclease